MAVMIAKTYESTFLYNKIDYSRRIVEFLSTCDEVDKKSEMFQDIAFDVKRRQVTSSLVTVLNSDKIVLVAGGKPLPKSFKVFGHKDIRRGESGEMKVFIDVSEIIKMQNGIYKCTNIDVLIAYLLSAMNTVIYMSDVRRYYTNSTIVQSGTESFVDLFMFVIDHLNISGFGAIRTKLEYMAGIYFQHCVLEKDINETMKSTCARISKISSRDQDVVDLLIDNADFDQLDSFISLIAKFMKADNLTVDVFIEKWIYLFGPSTHFATEIFIAFCNMMTNAYCGVYLNNQKTIEKVVGGNNLTSFTNALFKIGADAV